MKTFIVVAVILSTMLVPIEPRVGSDVQPIIPIKKVNIPKKISAKKKSIAGISTKAKLVVKQAPISSGGSIEQIIRNAASRYGLDQEHFLSVARCESGLDPTVVNTGYYAGGGHPSGLFQFIPDTWARMSSQSGIGGDVFDPVANANVAAWAWSTGHSGEWECQ